MHTISLNGLWQVDYLGPEPYTLTTEPVPGDSVTSIPVPGYWEDQMDRFRTTPLHAKLHYNPLYTLQRYPQAGYVPDMALPNPVGCFIYQRVFTVLQDMDADLWCGGVQNTMSVWVNGRYCGRHEGYSSSFTIPVQLHAGVNRITLAVSNVRLQGYMDRPVSGLTSRAACECTGGIYGDLEIRICEDDLKDLWVTTSEDCRFITIHTEGSACAKQAAVYDGSKCLMTLDMPDPELVIPTDAMELWSPADPKLYTAVVTTEHQRLERRFGIRRLTVQGTKLFLNGKPFYFRGDCEHCYHPLTVHPTRDKNYYRQVIRTLKSLGFNSIRFHTYVPQMEYMEAADELGILMEIETPNNTTYEEWCDIIRMARHYTAPVMYSSGNEMVIDEEYIEHLRKCAALVHTGSDSLFSPMSAMRGIEYFSFGTGRVEEPFTHDPKRLAKLGEFCDVYNSYSLGLTSYESVQGDPKVLDTRNAVYNKPLLSHEICINGTYADLSLKDRYRGSRIGDTELFTSVEKHLEDKGLLDRAPLYYKNSAGWQKLLRKHCFETVRRADSLAGYDFLGDIDTHWHTFGYCVGMMNEFYELKPGETAANVRQYNADTVLLADLPSCRNFVSGSRISVPILVSNYGESLPKATLRLRIASENKVYLRREIRLTDLAAGTLTSLYTLSFKSPKVDTPLKLTLHAELSGGNTDAENEWELYVYPAVRNRQVTTAMDAETLLKKLRKGETVVLFGPGPFTSTPTTFQLSIAGRTHGHLATVINDHPLLQDLPHNGYCGWQFRHLMEGGHSIILDETDIPYKPIIEIASSYKNARREALLFEYRVGKGRLLVCGLHLNEEDPGARWLRSRILAYSTSDAFNPAVAITESQLLALFAAEALQDTNANAAINMNDITM